MKEIPKLYMQIAMLIFGAIIAFTSIYTAHHISELRSELNSISWEVDSLNRKIDDVGSAVDDVKRELDDIHLYLLRR